MDQRRVTLIVIALLAALGPTADAAPLDAEDIAIHLSSPYFTCIKPADVHCTVYTEEDRESRCAQCREWTEHLTVVPAIVEPIDKTLFRPKQKNAKLFLREVLLKFYEMSPEHAARLTPPSIADLYDDPPRWGWRQVYVETPGAVKLDRHLVTFVLGGGKEIVYERRRPRNARRLIQELAEGTRNLFYPSSKAGGIQKSADREVFTDPDAPPKMVVPRAEPAKSDIPVASNAWFEEISREHGTRPQYLPLRRLDPGKRYQLVAHLSGIVYRNLYGAPTGLNALSRMTSLARTSDKTTERLTAVVLGDEAGLHAEEEIKDFDFSVERLRRWDVFGDKPEGDPMEILAKDPNQPFVFGEVMIDVTTKDREGLATVGVSVWDSEGWPIDEMTIPICVARDDASASRVCPEHPLITRGYGSYDLERMSVGDRPAAAVHFVDLGRNAINAALRYDDEANHRHIYTIWQIHRSSDALVKTLGAMANDFAAADDDEERAHAAERMRDILFAVDEPSNQRAHTALREFTKFAHAHMENEPASGRVAPLLFVRMTPRQTDDDRIPPVRVLPFGILKVDDDKPDSYLGNYFRVESPLVRQPTVDHVPCTARWKLIIPPADSADLQHLRLEHINPNLSSWIHSSDVLEKMRDVRSYLRPAIQDGQRTALIILSHFGATNPQEPARITWGRDYVASDEIHRVFAQPSVAVVSGCGTARPGAEAFVQQLNEHGVDAIIATRTSVSAEMGVQFLECFARTLPASSSSDADPAPLGEVMFDSVRCLRRAKPHGKNDIPGPPHGSAALAFTLLGNSRLPLCQPTGGQPAP